MIRVVAEPKKTQPITPQSEDFDDILARSPFVVPRYQRAYDWDAEEVRDWARDLRALAAGRLNSARRRHFFGAVISVVHAATNEFEVVDGQQRLATEILSLAELKARYEELAASAKAAGQKTVAAASRKAATSVAAKLEAGSGPRLTLSKRDKQFFADMLADTATEPKSSADQSHRRLWAARDLICDELFDQTLAGAATNAEHLKRLNAIRQALLEDGYLVHLFTSDPGEAYRLFMVLNDRGRPLSTGALLRTHTLALLEAHPTEQAGAEADWDTILAAGDRPVDAFLAAYYVSYEGDRALKGEMYDSFRHRFLVEELTGQAAAKRLRQVVAQLRDEMTTFQQIRAGDWPYESSKIKLWEQDRLRRLVFWLGHDLANPLLLSAARTVDEKTFRTLVLLLEPFVFRYINVVGASAARLGAEYYKFAKKTRDDEALDQNGLRNSLKQLLVQRAPDDLFILALREQLRFAQSAPRKRLIRHFLTTLEDYEVWYAGGAKGTRKVEDKTRVFDLNHVNIEHIYPQNAKTVDKALENLTNALGNLTALDETEGGKAGNDEFLDKKPVYAKSAFRISQELANIPDWDPTELQSRFDFYADRAKRIFIIE